MIDSPVILSKSLASYALRCGRHDSFGGLGTADSASSRNLTSDHASDLAICRCAENIGLDSFSQGFGEERHVTIYPKGQAPAKVGVTADMTTTRFETVRGFGKPDLTCGITKS